MVKSGTGGMGAVRPVSPCLYGLCTGGCYGVELSFGEGKLHLGSTASVLWEGTSLFPVPGEPVLPNCLRKERS